MYYLRLELSNGIQLYPFLQAGAIAAGNAVAIKASESSSATTALMTELAGEYLDKDLVRFINGAVPETTRVRLVDDK
jgi:acyl-CoA reductase-like NAD-dependent aldehyde dehydrogenase